MPSTYNRGVYFIFLIFNSIIHKKNLLILAIILYFHCEDKIGPNFLSGFFQSLVETQKFSFLVEHYYKYHILYLGERSNICIIGNVL